MVSDVICKIKRRGVWCDIGGLQTMEIDGSQGHEDIWRVALFDLN